MEKIIVNPLNVRGLGNVVDADNVMGEYNSLLTSVSDSTYGSVWNSEYLTGSYLSLSYDKVIASIGDLTVSLTLKDNTDTVIGSASVTCYFDGNTYTATTDNTGVASFTLPVTETGYHSFKVVYEGTNSIAGCIKLGSFYCGGLEHIELVSTENIIQEDDTIGLISIVSPGVPGVSVNFYEVYEPNTLTLTCSPLVFQSGDTATIKAILRDEDGSRIKGETINIYEPLSSIYDDCTGSDINRIWKTADSTKVSYWTYNGYNVILCEGSLGKLPFMDTILDIEYDIILSSDYGGLRVYDENDQCLTWVAAPEATNDEHAKSFYKIGKNNWYHIKQEIRSDSIKLYVNNTLVSTQSVTPTGQLRFTGGSNANPIRLKSIRISGVE